MHARSIGACADPLGSETTPSFLAFSARKATPKSSDALDSATSRAEPRMSARRDEKEPDMIGG